MDEGLQKAVIKTITYSDIFDYPLRISELHKYLIGLRVDDPLRFTSLFDADKRGLTQIGERNGYFFLQGQEKIVGLRRKREKISQEKIQKAKEVLNVLRHIPFIKMIAVTGAVAAGNADENSDIDVLIVTQKKRLWLARLLAIFLLELKRVRRPPPPRPWGTLPPSLYKDKVCLNMFLSEENLELPNKDLFTANEFARMKVVWEKDNTYERFVKANKWVSRFLPNWKSVVILTHQLAGKNPDGSAGIQRDPSLHFVPFRMTTLSLPVLNLLEHLVELIQLKYMQRRRTTEIVQNGLLMFHPYDAREWVMREYKNRLKNLDLTGT